jgi:Signal transduction histidine kinase
MPLNLFVQFIILLAALTLSVMTITYSWLNEKKSPILKCCLYAQAALLVWSFPEIFRFFAGNAKMDWLMIKIEFLGTCFMGLCWLAFCLYYTGSKYVRNPKGLILLCMIPTLCYISLLTNQYHHLFFLKNPQGTIQPQILFWIHIIETYCYCILGMALLIKYSAKLFNYKKKQAILLVVTGIIPLTVTLAHMSQSFNFEFDFVLLILSACLLLYAMVIFRYQLGNTEFVALRKIVDNIKESILITDGFNRIVDYNHTFVKDFPDFDSIQIGDQMNRFVDYLLENSENCDDSQRIIRAIAVESPSSTSGRLNLNAPRKECFDVNIQPIFCGKKFFGRMISFHNLTVQKNLWDQLFRKNIELSQNYKQLEQYADTVAELAVAKERNRFAREVHDTLGQSMTVLITLLQITKMNCRNNPEMTESRLDEALQIASNSLAKVRHSLINITTTETTSLKNALMSLVNDFKACGMKIDLSIGELGQYDDFMYSNVVYGICREAVTNSLRHGKASHVMIALALNEQWMYLSISDDGNGCKDLNKGFGLYGIEERIMKLKGDIIYNHGNAGFGIFVEIPLR